MEATKQIAERFGFNPNLLQRYLNDFGINAEANKEKLLNNEAAELLIELVFKGKDARLKNYLNGSGYTRTK